MKSSLKLAMSSLVLATTVAGCKSGDTRPLAISSYAPSADRQGVQAAAKASAAIAARDAAQAVKYAERAVSLSSRDADHRALLGQAYLLAGRFASAETSFQDALAINPDHGRAGLSLALAEIALGRADKAKATLERVRGAVPDADLGLALALAGDKEGAIYVLEAAARMQGATAKTRQNLALAYALAGRWNDAYANAALDVPANELPARLMKWAQIARPGGTTDQVAMLLGVTRATDPGQPTQLALAPIVAAEPVALAVAEPETPVQAVEPAAPAPVAAVVAAPATVAVVAKPVVAESKAPAAQSIFYTTQVPAPAPTPMLRTASAQARREPIMTVAPKRPIDRPQRQFVVQLGAYSNAAGVEAAWSKVGSRARRLGNHPPSSVTLVAAGRTIYRLSVGGFASGDEARILCRQVKADGGDCFVRATAGDAPIRWAAREKSVTLATR